jgi:hypothetical protein
MILSFRQSLRKFEQFGPVSLWTCTKEVGMMKVRMHILVTFVLTLGYTSFFVSLAIGESTEEKLWWSRKNGH